jgi:tripartite-type tricarboxylate transporter receptor subunit TctC
MVFIRNLFAACCAISVLALSGHAAWPQSGPDHQAGRSGAARRQHRRRGPLMAEQIGRAQGVTIVVENRPGASGMIGTEAVSRAAPDGNTLLMIANTYLIDAQTRKANYHPVTAFDPICYLVQSPAVFVVNSATPYKIFKDLLDAARARPGELSMAAVGPGTTFQMGFNTITKAAGVNMTFVPYQGSAPAATAVMGQHVTSAFAG